MTRLEDFQLDPAEIHAEFVEFRALLGAPAKELSERDHVLPFFKKNRNLAALVGYAHSTLCEPTLLKSELGIFGDWACDLAVGNKARGEFCFVEFENAAPDSIFRRAKKGVPDWAARFEHGLSQISDWFYHLAGNAHTPQFRSFFTTDLAHYSGLLVIGRDAFLTADQQHRLRWRAQNTLVGGKQVAIVTYDGLAAALEPRVSQLSHGW
jgi:hypothetical protein